MNAGITGFLRLVGITSVMLGTLYGCRTIGAPPMSLDRAVSMECLPISRYPKSVRATMKLPSGYSGLQTLGGTSREYCALQPGCRLYSKTEFEFLWNESVNSFMDTAIFALIPCRLEKDYPPFLASIENKAWRDSSIIDRPDAQRLLETMNGRWCGLHEKTEGFRATELMVMFQRRHDQLAIAGTMAWARIPGGPVGEDSYFKHMLLVPQVFDKTAQTFVFREISRYQNGQIWTLNAKEMLLRDNSGTDFHLFRTCDGYWDKAGPSPFN